jgi:hypothetical protein
MKLWVEILCVKKKQDKSSPTISRENQQLKTIAHDNRALKMHTKLAIELVVIFRKKSNRKMVNRSLQAKQENRVG